MKFASYLIAACLLMGCAATPPGTRAPVVKDEHYYSPLEKWRAEGLVEQVDVVQTNKVWRLTEKGRARQLKEP